MFIVLRIESNRGINRLSIQLLDCLLRVELDRTEAGRLEEYQVCRANFKCTWMHILCESSSRDAASSKHECRMPLFINRD